MKILAITALLIVTAITGLFTPKINWDVIGYIATIKSQIETNPTIIHKLTYDEIQSSVEKKEFEHLVDPKTAYRATVYKDPESLAQQIPFYKIRIVYIELIKLFNKIGIPLLKATYFVSTFFTMLGCIYIIRITELAGIKPYWGIFAAAISGFISLSQFSSPDALASCASIILIYYTLKNHEITSLSLASLLPLLRTDFIIFSFLIIIYHLTYNKKKILPSASALIAITLYVLIQDYAGNYGWWTIFYFTLIQITPYPETISTEINLTLMLDAYKNAIVKFFDHYHSIIALIISILLVIYKPVNFGRIEILLGLIPTAFIIIHWLVFPMYETRFFAFSIVLIVIFTINSIQCSKIKSNDIQLK